MQKHRVRLTEEERKKLLAIVSKGRNKAVVIQRLHLKDARKVFKGLLPR